MAFLLFRILRRRRHIRALWGKLEPTSGARSRSPARADTSPPRSSSSSVMARSDLPAFNRNLPTCPQCQARMRLVHSMESGSPYTGPTGGQIEVEINLLLEALASVE